MLPLSGSYLLCYRNYLYRFTFSFHPSRSEAIYQHLGEKNLAQELQQAVTNILKSSSSVPIVQTNHLLVRTKTEVWSRQSKIQALIHFTEYQPQPIPYNKAYFFRVVVVRNKQVHNDGSDNMGGRIYRRMLEPAAVQGPSTSQVVEQVGVSTCQDDPDIFSNIVKFIDSNDKQEKFSCLPNVPCSSVLNTVSNKRIFKILNGNHKVSSSKSEYDLFCETTKKRSKSLSCLYVTPEPIVALKKPKAFSDPPLYVSKLQEEMDYTITSRDSVDLQGRCLKSIELAQVNANGDKTLQDMPSLVREFDLIENHNYESLTDTPLKSCELKSGIFPLVNSPPHLDKENDEAITNRSKDSHDTSQAMNVQIFLDKENDVLKRRNKEVNCHDTSQAVDSGHICILIDKLHLTSVCTNSPVNTTELEMTEQLELELNNLSHVVGDEHECLGANDSVVACTKDVITNNEELNTSLNCKKMTLQVYNNMLDTSVNGSRLTPESDTHMLDTSVSGNILTPETNNQLLDTSVNGSNLIHKVDNHMLDTSVNGSKLMKTDNHVLGTNVNGTKFTPENDNRLLDTSVTGNGLTLETSTRMLDTSVNGSTLTLEENNQNLNSSFSGNGFTLDCDNHMLDTSVTSSISTLEVKQELNLTLRTLPPRKCKRDNSVCSWMPTRKRLKLDNENIKPLHCTNTTVYLNYAKLLCNLFHHYPIVVMKKLKLDPKKTYKIKRRKRSEVLELQVKRKMEAKS